MFNSFDKMFDLNRDGKLDWGERGVQFQFIEDTMKKEKERRDAEDKEKKDKI